MKLEFKNFKYLTNDENLEVLRIRNSDYIRKMMRSDSIIKLNEHLNWLSNLDNKSNKYFAVSSKNVILGSVYITDINYEDSTAFWGLYFKNNNNPLLPAISSIKIVDYIFNKLNILKLNLEVKKENIKVISFDKNLGFELYNSTNEYLYMSLTKDKWMEIRSSKILSVLNKKLIEYNINIID